MQVETIEGTNMYRLFEHVTVGIQLKGSEAHAHVLNLRYLAVFCTTCILLSYAAAFWRKPLGKGRGKRRLKETNSTF